MREHTSYVSRDAEPAALVPVPGLDYCVVIPAKNAAAFIDRALASVQAQSAPALEVVVVDDGSTDATAAICQSRGVRVVYLSESRGPSAARNCGVAATTAPLIAFLDADDEWMPTHTQELLRIVSLNGVAFAASDAERFGTETGLISHGLSSRSGLDLPDLLILENPIIQSAVMIRRSAFDAAGGYDESLRYSEDYDLWNRLLDFGRFGYVETATVRRRMHPAQLTATNRPELVRSSSEVRRRMLRTRLSGAKADERQRVLELLHDAAKTELDWAIWTGDKSMLEIVRAELLQTDSHLGFGNRLARSGGADDAFRLVWQNVRCASRRVLNVVARWVR